MDRIIEHYRQPEKVSVLIPSEQLGGITENWLAGFNERYSDKNCVATMEVESWYEQPEDSISPTDYHYREAFDLNDWKQTITGTIEIAGLAQIPNNSDLPVGVVSLTNAETIGRDGSRKALAEGRIVLVRLDEVLDGVMEVNTPE